MKRTFVIGDIHGCFDEFIQLIEQIGITDKDLILSLGDVVDRGNKSLELYHYFKNHRNTLMIMGNHERKHQNGVLNYAQEIVKVQFGNEYEGFVDWLDTIEYSYETDEAIIVHAFFEHDKSLSEQKQEVLAGTTSGSRYLENKYPEGTYWSDYYAGHKPIIYGHHVVGDHPKIKNNTYGIDTGACHGGRLTAIELPGFTIHQVQVSKDHWKEEQALWQVPVLKAKDWEAMKIAQIHQQMGKLGYKEEEEVREFLASLSHWIENVERLISIIKDHIERKGIELKEQHGTEFNREAAKLSYRTFLFKAQASNLSLEDLQKVLDTPLKVIDLALSLRIDSIPKKPF